MHKNWMQHKNEDKTALEELWNLSEDYKGSYRPDIDKGLAKLKSKIAKDQQSTAPTAEVIDISRRRLLPRIAAAAMIFLACAYLLNLWVNNADELQQIVTTTTQKENVLLPDGSTVWVNKRSELSFPSNFSKDARVIKLKGEAFFKVTKNANKPFIVQTTESEVKVLGTAFNVRAYANESVTSIEVEEGSVAVSILSTQQKKILQANEKVVFDRSNATLSDLMVLDWKDTAWKGERIDFSDQSISEVVNYLKDNFGVVVDFEAEKLGNCTFNATLVKNSPEAILKRLTSAFESLKLKEVRTKYYQLSGNNCD